MPRDSRTAVRKRIASQRENIMPLEEFSPCAQARIAVHVSGHRPPEQWIPLGGDSPRPLAWMPSRAWYEWHWQRDIDPGTGRARIPNSVRLAVIKRDGYVCQLCFDFVKQGDVHLDHVIAYSRGGPDTVANLRVTHSRCNMRRGAGA